MSDFGPYKMTRLQYDKPDDSFKQDNKALFTQKIEKLV